MSFERKPLQSTPIIAGLTIAAAATAGRFAIQAWKNFLSRGPRTAVIGGRKIPKNYMGGFQSEMDRKEALLILGLKEGATRDEIRDAHRKLMLMNHPDNGGSTLLATKVNEAKDFLISGKRGSRVL